MKKIAVYVASVYSGWVILFISASIAFTLFVIYATTVQALANTPDFNKGSLNGGAFPIQTATGVVDNVAGTPGNPSSYEPNFVRAGYRWSQDGDYVAGGNRLQTCEDNQIITLWVYAHNTINADYNHQNKTNLDFQGTAVAKNTTVSVTSPNLDKGVFTNSHVITGTLNADNANSKSDTTEIYCDDQEIALISKGAVNSPQIYTWANVPFNRAKHKKAQQVFGSGYKLSHPERIFSTGSEFGYDGNLPACRYYGAYVRIELEVLVKPPAEAPTPPEPPITPPTPPEPPITPPTPPTPPLPPGKPPTPPEVPVTGIDDASLINTGAIILAVSAAAAGTLIARLATSRRRL